jgi:hypothetical protein
LGSVTSPTFFGIAVINPPGRASMELLKELVMSMLMTIYVEGVRGKLCS